MYRTSKAALEPSTRGFAHEVGRHGVSVNCYSPAVGVATEGTALVGLIKSLDAPDRRPVPITTRAAPLLATERRDALTGRVSYCPTIFQEFGWSRTASAGHPLARRGDSGE